jgi:hypothetical protein
VRRATVADEWGGDVGGAAKHLERLQLIERDVKEICSLGRHVSKPTNPS